jgi:hypothetical protein
MNDKTKNILLIGGSLIVIGGVAYYLYRQAHPKAPKAGDKPAGDVPKDVPAPVPAEVAEAPKQSLPDEINTVEKIKKFQDFMDSIKPWIKNADGTFKKLNKGTGYGSFGPATKAAFDKYADLYRVYTRAYPRGLTQIELDVPMVDINLSNGTIARYRNDKIFLQFAKNFGSVINRGEWTSGGRKIAIYNGTKTGKIIDKTSIWDTLKELIA